MRPHRKSMMICELWYLQWEDNIHLCMSVSSDPAGAVEQLTSYLTRLNYRFMWAGSNWKRTKLRNRVNNYCAGSELWVMLDPQVLLKVCVKRTEENKFVCVCVCICWKFSEHGGQHGRIQLPTSVKLPHLQIE